MYALLLALSQQLYKGKEVSEFTQHVEEHVVLIKLTWRHENTPN